MLVRIVVCGVALCMLASVSSADEPKETKLKPTIVFTGKHSQIRHERFEVITTESGWKELWKLHRGEEHDPPFTETWQELNIDFDTYYVIGIFSGGNNALAVTAFSKGDSVLVRFTARGYQTEGGLGEDNRTEHQKAKEKALADYCLVVLPRPVKTVIIEEDVRRRLIDPPLWKERTRFPPPKDKK